jgi:hypothetical protein
MIRCRPNNKKPFIPKPVVCCDSFFSLISILFVRHRRYSDVHRNGRRKFAMFNTVYSPPITDRSGEAFFRHDPSLLPRVKRVVNVNQFPTHACYCWSKTLALSSGVRFSFRYTDSTTSLRSVRRYTCRSSSYLRYFACVDTFFYYIINVVAVVNFDQCFLNFYYRFRGLSRRHPSSEPRVGATWTAFYPVRPPAVVFSYVNFVGVT